MISYANLAVFLLLGEVESFQIAASSESICHPPEELTWKGWTSVIKKQNQSSSFYKIMGATLFRNWHQSRICLWTGSVTASQELRSQEQFPKMSIWKREKHFLLTDWPRTIVCLIHPYLMWCWSTKSGCLMLEWKLFPRYCHHPKLIALQNSSTSQSEIDSAYGQTFCRDWIRTIFSIYVNWNV